MGRKLKSTPRSRVRSALRQVFLRSRERAACIKAHNNTCVGCRRKASVAKGKEFKVQVHYIGGIGNWEKIIDMVFEELLCDPSLMTVMCKECHDEE